MDSGISCFLVYLRHLHPFLNFFIGMSSACFIRILRGGVKSGIENESEYKLSGKPLSVTVVSKQFDTRTRMRAENQRQLSRYRQKRFGK